jgi:hypothetical protein
MAGFVAVRVENSCPVAAGLLRTVEGCAVTIGLRDVQPRLQPVAVYQFLVGYMPGI